MKKQIFILLIGVTILGSCMSTFAALSEDELKNSIIPGSSTDILSTGTVGESGEDFLDVILAFARDSIFALMAVIAIGMFLYIGARLVMARGNPEEFKKAIMSFVYAAVGIFIVAASYALVRLIAGLNI